MKKIGILTLQNSNNFGALYQTFALQEFLISQGHEVFIINYDMARDRQSKGFYLKNSSALIQKLAHRKVFSLKFFSDRKELQLKREVEVKFDQIFKDFRRSYLNITEEEFDYKSLCQRAPKADIYICGSDQIWAADFLFTSPAFLLGFVPEGIKRVSYAPSFGKKSLQGYLHGTFKEYIKQFDAISVREDSGKEIIKDVAGLEAEVVLDPTLLLDRSDYKKILDTSSVPQKPYVLVYLLSQEKKLMAWTIEMINAAKTQMGWDVLYVTTNNIWPPDQSWQVIHPTPNQLLGLIEESQMVLTNSFHGSVFSIIMEKRFISLARDPYPDKQNLRMIGLTAKLGLERRFLKPFAKLNKLEGLIDKDIDFVEAKKNLGAMKEKSLSYLSGAIE